MKRSRLCSTARCGVLPVALLATLALAGCNEISGDSAGPATSATGVIPAQFHLPPGAACSGEISRYQTIIASDLQTGNLEQKVYDQIEHELARASAACSAGHGGEAHSIVASSKARHGYRT